jgi:hypothetical protein
MSQIAAHLRRTTVFRADRTSAAKSGKVQLRNFTVMRGSCLLFPSLSKNWARAAKRLIFQPSRAESRDGFGERCGTLCPGAGGVRRRARSGTLREQGVLGECGTMNRACRETPGGAGGVANDDPARGVQSGGALSGLAESPWRVREGRTSLERRDSAAGVRGRQPPANV